MHLCCSLAVQSPQHEPLSSRPVTAQPTAPAKAATSSSHRPRRHPLTPHPYLPTPLQIWEENRLLVQPGSSSLQEHCLALPAKPEGRPTPFGLQVDSGTVLVDDLVLYCHVEQQGVYGVDGGELALAGAVRSMNAALPQESFVKLWAD